MSQPSVAAKFHEERRFPDAYLQTAAEAATFFTTAEIENHTFFKIGYVVAQGQGFITVLKYDGQRDGQSPSQKILMQEDALAHMVSALSKNKTDKGQALLHEMREGLRMAQCFNAETVQPVSKPKGLIAA